MAPWFWASRPWARSYVKMLKVTYRAIHRADRGAKVVAGSFVGVGDYTQWEGIRDLYKAGAKGYFDVIAVHPFTNNPKSARNSVSRMLEIVQRVRAVMKKRRDGRKKIILTELTWPAAVGKVPKRRLLGLETTTKGQRQRMVEAYSRLAKVRRKMRITHAYWFAWATPYDDNTPQSDVSYRYTGLSRVGDGGAFSADADPEHLHEPRLEVPGLPQVGRRAPLPVARSSIISLPPRASAESPEAGKGAYA